VPDGVNNGQFGAGPVIDFFGLAGRYSGFPVDFVYPTVTSIVPANIALIDGSKNPSEGKQFVAFTLSDEGQQLLLDPKISRLPVLPYAKLAGKIPEGYPDPEQIAKRSKVQFDANLSEARYYVVQSMFDQTITFRLKELQGAARAIFEAEKKLAGKTSPQAAELLKEARGLAFTPIVGSDLAKDPRFLELFAKSKKDAAVNKEITGLEGTWNTKAKANYERAVSLAQQAAALAR